MNKSCLKGIRIPRTKLTYDIGSIVIEEMWKSGYFWRTEDVVKMIRNSGFIEGKEASFVCKNQ